MNKRHPSNLEQVRWHPPGGYVLDIEVLSIQELKRRGSAAHFARPQHVEFHIVTAVTRGRCRHVIDFTPHVGGPGMWMVVSPGQVQRYDFTHDWDGWSVVFRPELLMPRRQVAVVADRTVANQLADLPAALVLPAGDHKLGVRIMQQLLTDATSAESVPDRNALMRLQVYQLVLRLTLAQTRQAGAPQASPAMMQRVIRFRRDLDRDLRHHHDIRHFAALQNCTEKTLSRATHAVTGSSAKPMLMARIALEGKRLLVHTDLPVEAIAEDLGFDESTNFAKFFRRVTGISPGAFRQRQATAR